LPKPIPFRPKLPRIEHSSLGVSHFLDKVHTYIEGQGPELSGRKYSFYETVYGKDPKAILLGFIRDMHQTEVVQFINDINRSTPLEPGEKKAILDFWSHVKSNGAVNFKQPTQPEPRPQRTDRRSREPSASTAPRTERREEPHTEPEAATEQESTRSTPLSRTETTTDTQKKSRWQRAKERFAEFRESRKKEPTELEKRFAEATQIGKSGRYQEAIDLYNRLLEDENLNLTTDQRHMIHANMGYCYEQLGDFGKATHNYSIASSYKDTRKVRKAFNRADKKHAKALDAESPSAPKKTTKSNAKENNSYIKINLLPKKKSWLERAKERLSEIRNERKERSTRSKELKAQSKKQIAEFKKRFAEAVKLGKSKEYKEAIDLYNKMLEDESLNLTNDQRHMIHANMGYCYEQLGDFERATKSYLNALSFKSSKQIENAYSRVSKTQEDISEQSANEENLKRKKESEVADETSNAKEQELKVQELSDELYRTYEEFDKLDTAASDYRLRSADATHKLEDITEQLAKIDPENAHLHYYTISKLNPNQYRSVEYLIKAIESKNFGKNQRVTESILFNFFQKIERYSEHSSYATGVFKRYKTEIYNSDLRTIQMIFKSMCEIAIREEDPIAHRYYKTLLEIDRRLGDTQSKTKTSPSNLLALDIKALKDKGISDDGFEAIDLDKEIADAKTTIAERNNEIISDGDKTVQNFFEQGEEQNKRAESTNKGLFESASKWLFGRKKERIGRIREPENIIAEEDRQDITRTEEREPIDELDEMEETKDETKESDLVDDMTPEEKSIDEYNTKVRDLFDQLKSATDKERIVEDIALECEVLLAKFPKSFRARIRVAENYHKLGDVQDPKYYQNAETQYATAISLTTFLPERIGAVREILEICELTKRPEKLITIAEEFARNNSITLDELGGYSKGMIDNARKQVELDSKARKEPVLSDTRLVEAKSLMQDKKYQVARLKLETLLKDFPNSTIVLSEYAYCLENVGDYKKAEATYRRIIENLKNDYANKPEDVQKLIEERMQYNQEHLGNCLYEQKQYENAIIEYGKTTLGPTRFEKVGMCYLRMKDFTSARSHFESALSLDPKRILPKEAKEFMNA